MITVKAHAAPSKAQLQFHGYDCRDDDYPRWSLLEYAIRRSLCKGQSKPTRDCRHVVVTVSSRMRFSSLTRQLLAAVCGPQAAPRLRPGSYHRPSRAATPPRKPPAQRPPAWRSCATSALSAATVALSSSIAPLRPFLAAPKPAGALVGEAPSAGAASAAASPGESARDP